MSKAPGQHQAIGPRRRHDPAWRDSGTLRVRVPGPLLTYEKARAAIERLPARRRRGAIVELDFSDIRDVGRPWTPVFAVILQYARRTGANVVLTHLSSRVAAMTSVVLRGVCRPMVRVRPGVRRRNARRRQMSGSNRRIAECSE